VLELEQEQKIDEAGGGEARRERFPTNPSILKNQYAHKYGSQLVQCGHLD